MQPTVDSPQPTESSKSDRALAAAVANYLLSVRAR